MKSGTLGKVALVAATMANVYKVDIGNTAVVSLSLVNSDPLTNAKVRVAITDASSPSMADYIEYDVVLNSMGGVLERTGIVMGAGEQLFFRSDITGVIGRVYGYEESSV